MRFLEENEIQDWCNNRGIALDLPFTSQSRVQFSNKDLSVVAFPISKECVASLGECSECLLLVAEWGIWPSSEDWPAYYMARGSFNEKRSIDVAPGHLFESHESILLVQFLALIIQNGWNAYVLPVVDDKPYRHYVYVSHDGWLEFRSHA